jgi:uncharacterized membrane protein
MNLRQRLRTLFDDLASSLWFRPAVGAFLAVLLAAGVIELDQRFSFSQLDSMRIGVDAARGVLAIIAGAMLTVVGLIFSIMMVVLVLGSQQFSPRILRNFVRDPVTQNVLAVFISAFVFCLLVLARTSEAPGGLSTPIFSVIVAITLALVAIAAFIFFIDHITRIVRVNFIIADINRQTLGRLQILDDQIRSGGADSTEPVHERHTRRAVIVHALGFGYIQLIDMDALVVLARQHDLVIYLERQVGDFVPKAGRLATVWLPTQETDDKLPSDFVSELWRAFDVGAERTMLDDVLFGIRQLVDIALKALSPAVNDPTTAANCVDYLTNILVQAAHQPDASTEWQDEDGVLRVVCRQPGFAAMLDLAFDQLRHYSRADFSFTLHLLQALTELAEATQVPERRAALWRHAGMISRSVDPQIREPLERMQINDKLRMLAELIGEQSVGALLHTEEPLYAQFTKAKSELKSDAKL